MHALCAAAPALRSGDDTEPVDPGRGRSPDEPAYALDEPTGVPHALPALRKQAEPEGDPASAKSARSCGLADRRACREGPIHRQLSD